MLVSYLFEAGWMFFATWSAIVAAAVVAAFGEDFLPSMASKKWPLQKWRSQKWASQKSPSPAPAARPGARSLLR